MIRAYLTTPEPGARPLPMRIRYRLGVATAGLLAAGIAGCINVTAPSEPIVIELNVNIKQEVLYRLVDSAEENIEDNPEIF